MLSPFIEVKSACWHRGIMGGEKCIVDRSIRASKLLADSESQRVAYRLLRCNS